VGCLNEEGPDSDDPERPPPPANWLEILRDLETQTALAVAGMENARREYESMARREARSADRDPAAQLRSIRTAARQKAKSFFKRVRRIS
jgi:hypothetical protein